MNRNVVAVMIVSLVGLMAGQASAQAPPPLTSFTAGSGGCSATPLPLSGSSGGSYGPCSLVAQTSEDVVSGLTGVKLYATNGSFEISNLGGDFGMAILAFGGVNGGGEELTAPFTGTIPVSWDFTPSSSDGSNLSYALFFEFYTSGNVFEISEGDLNNFNLASETEVAGTSSISLTNAAIESYSITLDVEGQPGASSITVAIPQNSVDIAPPAPEPASVLLFGSGMAGLLFRGLRRKV
jgi:hypothetical protein